MANWYGSSRTNYVKIINEPGLNNWLKRVEAEVELVHRDGLTAFLATSEDGAFSSCFMDDEFNTIGEFEFGMEIMQFVDPDSVLVVQEVGAEKLRYLSGWATAYAWQNGEIATCSITINDIYREANRRFGKTPTEATY